MENPKLRNMDERIQHLPIEARCHIWHEFYHGTSIQLEKLIAYYSAEHRSRGVDGGPIPKP